MKIELRNFKMNLAFSEETIMFSADVYVDGVKCMYARNDGHGGSTDYHFYTGMKSLMEKANAYAMSLDGETFTLPDGKQYTQKSTLEGLIDRLVDEKVRAKEKAANDKKKAKLMETHILWGVPNGNTYHALSFKGKPKFADLLKTPQGIAAINKMHGRVISELKKGEVIFNTNLK